MQNYPCGGISVLLEEASSVRLSLSRPTTVITIFKDPPQPLFKMIQCFFFPSSNKTENFICFCLQDISVKSVRLHILTGIPNTVATLLMCNTKKLFSVGRVLNHQISSKAQEEGRNRRKEKEKGEQYVIVSIQQPAPSQSTGAAVTSLFTIGFLCWQPLLEAVLLPIEISP